MQEGTLAEKLERIGHVTSAYGRDFIIGLCILIFGILITRLVINLLRQLLEKSGLKPALSATIASVVRILLYVTVTILAVSTLGLDSANVIKFVVVIALAIIAFILLCRPYIPSLPFTVGNTIKTGDLLGKVEATTFLNTRMRTFDGKTVWIPNSKIVNDYLINYHYTPSRKIHLDMVIGYDQDLMKAKQALEYIMIGDPRILQKPRPAVFVTNLLPDGVALGGRCWVNNLKYWRTRCDLLEKVKLTFDHHAIAFAHPKRDVHIRNCDDDERKMDMDAESNTPEDG